MWKSECGMKKKPEAEWPEHPEIRSSAIKLDKLRG
jgi:hypothetical protein